MTREQKIFLAGKQILAHYNEIEQHRALNFQEQSKKDAVLSKLFGTIEGYAISLIESKTIGFGKDSDARADILEDIAVIFFENLPKYNPVQSTPSTFFQKYFNQAIAHYLNNFSQHLTAYDAEKVTQVRKAIYYYQSKNIKWDETMLMNHTGLSAKVIHNTLKIINNSIQLNIDDFFDLESKSPTPEDICINNDTQNLIINIIRASLTNDEFNLFIYKMNLMGNRTLTNPEVSKQMNLPLKEVTTTWKTIIKKLKKKELRKLLPASRLNKLNTIQKQQPQLTFSVHNSISNELQKDFLTTFNVD